MRYGCTEMATPRIAETTRPLVAVVIPCFNEAPTVGKVVQDFHAAIPEADIVVIDNNSTDRTVEVARTAGARVLFEHRQGKGFAVQSMFRRIHADILVMVDGDDTYPAEVVRALVDPVLRGEADMVVGSRLQQGAASQFRLVNRLGNRLLLGVLNTVFRVRLTDLLSGYRAFSRRLGRALPLAGGGFEIEAELTIKTLQRGFAIKEVPVNLTHRPPGSHSKIRILRDGFLILSTILALFRDYKPLTFFGAIGLFLVVVGLLPGGVVIVEFARTGLVPRLPSAILAVGLVLSGVVSGAVGLVLHATARRFQEVEVLLDRLAQDEPEHTERD